MTLEQPIRKNASGTEYHVVVEDFPIPDGFTEVADEATARAIDEHAQNFDPTPKI